MCLKQRQGEALDLQAAGGQRMALEKRWMQSMGGAVVAYRFSGLDIPAVP